MNQPRQPSAKRMSGRELRTRFLVAALFLALAIGVRARHHGQRRGSGEGQGANSAPPTPTPPFEKTELRSTSPTELLARMQGLTTTLADAAASAAARKQAAAQLAELWPEALVAVAALQANADAAAKAPASEAPKEAESNGTVQDAVALGSLVVSLLTAISTILLAWRSDRRAATELQLRLAQLQGQPLAPPDERAAQA